MLKSIRYEQEEEGGQLHQPRTEAEDKLKLEHYKIYYVAAPLTSCGNIDANYFSENYYHAKISDLVKGSCGIIRPLRCLPDTRTSDMDWAEAMQKCFALLRVADGIIMCPGWEHSKGCQEERAYAEHMGMEIVEYEELFAEEYDKVYGATENRISETLMNLLDVYDGIQ